MDHSHPPLPNRISPVFWGRGSGGGGRGEGLELEAASAGTGPAKAPTYQPISLPLLFLRLRKGKLDMLMAAWWFSDAEIDHVL